MDELKYFDVQEMSDYPIYLHRFIVFYKIQIWFYTQKVNAIW